MAKGTVAARKFKFPFVRPRAHLPAFGEKFGERHMQPLARAVFRRASSIYGIPVTDLAPVRQPSARQFRKATPGHQPERHDIEIGAIGLRDLPRAIKFYRLQGPRTSFLQHEMLHAIHYLLSRDYQNATTYWRERIAEVGIWRFPEGWNVHSQENPANQVYENYGPDGLLLLMAKSHELAGEPGVEPFIREVEARKLLEKGRGFTAAGLDELKRLATREEILERLRKAEQNRAREIKYLNFGKKTT